MKLYHLIFFILLFQFHDGQAQNQPEEERMEGIFDGLSTRVLLNVLMSSDTSGIELKQLLEFKIPIYHPLLKSCRINSKFGNRLHPILKKVKFHSGIDLKASLNQSVYATADGEVIEVGYQAGLGNFIKIKHSLGFETIYGHLSSINIAIKDKVYQGQTIGFCGNTGSSTGVHLHYSVLRFQRFINPLALL